LGINISSSITILSAPCCYQKQHSHGAWPISAFRVQILSRRRRACLPRAQKPKTTLATVPCWKSSVSAAQTHLKNRMSCLSKSRLLSQNHGSRDDVYVLPVRNHTSSSSWLQDTQPDHDSLSSSCPKVFPSSRTLLTLTFSLLTRKKEDLLACLSAPLSSRLLSCLTCASNETMML
jgi:hypothetical protein